MAKRNVLKVILGVDVAITNMERVVGYISRNYMHHKGQYITMCNAESAVRAYESDEYCRVLNEAFVVLPDGESIPMIHRMRGFKKAEQVHGDSLRRYIWEATEKLPVEHYIYCGDQKIADGIRHEIDESYPWLKVAALEADKSVGVMTADESDALVADVNKSGADILWLLGGDAAMQDVWMHGRAKDVKALVIGIGKRKKKFGLFSSIKYIAYLIKYILR